MLLGKLARIVQGARGDYNLLDQFGTNAAASVQDPLNRSGSHSSKTRNIPIVGLAHLGVLQTANTSRSDTVWAAHSRYQTI